MTNGCMTKYTAVRVCVCVCVCGIIAVAVRHLLGKGIIEAYYPCYFEPSALP